MYDITIQRVVALKSLPSNSKFKKWVTAVLTNKMPSAELTIRIVDKKEMTELNSTYRHKNKPTNVLSFPFDMPEECEDDMPILGDIVICAEVISEEASSQEKTLEAHWAHMVVHGILHLLGYDHEKETDAEKMEAEEITILAGLGFRNPYLINDVSSINLHTSSRSLSAGSRERNDPVLDPADKPRDDVDKLVDDTFEQGGKK